jgi:hypothetical protein
VLGVFSSAFAYAPEDDYIGKQSSRSFPSPASTDRHRRGCLVPHHPYEARMVGHSEPASNATPRRVALISSNPAWLAEPGRRRGGRLSGLTALHAGLSLGAKAVSHAPDTWPHPCPDESYPSKPESFEKAGCLKAEKILNKADQNPMKLCECPTSHPKSPAATTTALSPCR